MKKLIACLGYNLNPDGSIPPILQNRLNDSIKLAQDAPGSELLLMGAQSYQDNTTLSSQASAMFDYVTCATSDIDVTRIRKEERSTSALQQVFALRDYMSRYELTVVASEYYIDRIRFFAAYLLGQEAIIHFVGSAIPQDQREAFREAEGLKLETARRWLAKHQEAGDHEAIIAEEQAFQDFAKAQLAQQPGSWVDYHKP